VVQRVGGGHYGLARNTRRRGVAARTVVHHRETDPAVAVHVGGERVAFLLELEGNLPLGDCCQLVGEKEADGDGVVDGIEETFVDGDVAGIARECHARGELRLAPARQRHRQRARVEGDRRHVV
jgi:hypothetical protein